MIVLEDESEEEILVDDNKQILFHLERYLWQRRERTENHTKNSQDFFIDLLCDFVISQDAELSELDVGTKRIIADNEKIREELWTLNRNLHTLNKKIIPVEKESMPRAEQFAKERVQAVAKYLWSLYPDMTQPEMAAHEAIFNLGITKSKNYKPETVRKWVAEVDPRPPEKKKGRPRKKLK